MHPPIRCLAIGATLAGIAATATPALASVPPTCSYDPTAKSVRVIDGTGSGNLRIGPSSSGFLVVQEGADPFKLCTSPRLDFATVNNTDSILVDGRAVSEADGYTIDMRDGVLGPGATPESDGNSEIEVTVSQRTAPKPEVAVLATPQDDRVSIGRGAGNSNGVLLGPDDDVDVKLFRPERTAFDASAYVVSGGGGNDILSGHGGPGLSPILSRVSLSGDDGNDTLHDGHLALDHLSGGAGNDSLFSADVSIDTLFGGPGFDTASVDPADTTGADIEQRTNNVGRLKLSPAVAQVQAGEVARMRMSWTHPKAWRQLRSIEWRVLRGSHVVGRVVVKPATGRLRARGAVALAAGSRVRHHDKTVTAKVAVRLPRSLAGARLRVDVEATDRHGRRQLAPAAGTIEVR